MNINDMTGTQVAAHFSKFYNVEQLFQDYEEWKDKEKEIKAKLEKIYNKLSNGGLLRQNRSKIVKNRDKLELRIKKTDPRIVKRSMFKKWIENLCGSDYTKSCEYKAVRKLESAMDEEEYKESGLPYFKFMRSGSGLQAYHKIVSFRDYSIITVNELASKDSNRIETKRKKTKQIISRVKEYYGDNVPAEILATESRLDMVYDFQKEVSMIFDGMIKTQTRALSDVKEFEKLEHKMEELTEEVKEELEEEKKQD